MNPQNNKNARLVGLFLLGSVLFNFPVLSLFNLDVTVGRIPFLFLFMFLGWGLFILLIYFAAR